MHRNTFINSPKLLGADFSLRSDRRIFFAGQITGVEGYMESAASGILAGINAARYINGKDPFVMPGDTVMGALARYISDESVTDFSPWAQTSEYFRPSTSVSARSRSDMKNLAERIGIREKIYRRRE